MSTHLGKGFAKNGVVRDSVKRIFDFVAEQDGWFAPVGEVLEWTKKNNDHTSISDSERTHLEWRWMLERIKGKYLTPRNPAQWWEL